MSGLQWTKGLELHSPPPLHDDTDKNKKKRVKSTRQSLHVITSEDYNFRKLDEII